MNKNEVWPPELVEQYKRGKTIMDARRLDRERSRAYLIEQGIADLQAKFDAVLGRHNEPKASIRKA